VRLESFVVPIFDNILAYFRKRVNRFHGIVDRARDKVVATHGPDHIHKFHLARLLDGAASLDLDLKALASDEDARDVGAADDAVSDQRAVAIGGTGWLLPNPTYPSLRQRQHYLLHE